MSVWKDEPIELQNKKSWESTTALGCLTTMLLPYESKYLKIGIYKSHKYFDDISKLTFNNPSRINLKHKINQFEGNEGGHGNDDDKYCHAKIDLNYINSLNLKYSKKHEEKQ